MSDLAAEALVAVTGINPRTPPTPEDLLAAQSLVERWAGKVRRFLRGDKQPMPWKPPPPSQKLQDRVIQQPTPMEVEAWFAALNEPGLGLDYLATIQRGREHVDSIWPKIAAPGVAADVFPLAHDDLDEVWSVYRVLDDPDLILDEILAWTLTIEQVTAWRTVYPELSSLLDDVVAEQLIDWIASGKPLMWQQEDVIRTLQGLPMEAPIVVAASEAPEVKQPTPRQIKYESLLTPAERAASK
jgi:hypothetical protein